MVNAKSTWWGRLSASSALRVLVAGAWMLTACAPAPSSAAGNGALILVMNAGDHTVSLLNATGRAISTPLVIARTHSEVVVGGGTDALTYGSAPGSGLAHLSRDGHRWRSRALMVGEGRDTVEHAALLPGRAAVVHSTPMGSSTSRRRAAGCQLSVLDLPTGATARTVPLCAAGEVATGLVGVHTPEGRLAYVALWNRAQRSEEASGSSRLIALDLDSGTVKRSLRLDGPLTELSIGRTESDDAPTVYAVRAQQNINLPIDSSDDPSSAPDSFIWSLLRIEPVSLTVELDVPVTGQLRGIALSQDGRYAYARRPGVTHTWLIRVDVLTGVERRLGQAPGLSFGPVAMGDALVMADHFRDSLWLFDRRTGDVTRTISVGKRPTGLALTN